MAGIISQTTAVCNAKIACENCILPTASDLPGGAAGGHGTDPTGQRGFVRKCLGLLSGARNCEATGSRRCISGGLRRRPGNADRKPVHSAIYHPRSGVLRLRVGDFAVVVKALEAGQTVVSAGGEPRGDRARYKQFFCSGGSGSSGEEGAHGNEQTRLMMMLAGHERRESYS